MRRTESENIENTCTYFIYRYSYSNYIPKCVYTILCRLCIVYNRRPLMNVLLLHDEHIIILTLLLLLCAVDGRDNLLLKGDSYRYIIYVLLTTNTILL